MTRPTVGILALGAANRASIALGLERAGARVEFIESAGQIGEARVLVIPGVAHVGYMVDALDKFALRTTLLKKIAGGTPLLGICAGYQLLFERSEEAPQARGLGVFEGTVKALRGPKRPHIGWNEVEATNEAGGRKSGAGEKSARWAYFAHSFAPPASVRAAIARTTYGAPFASIAQRGATLGVQFHPERSGAYGETLLRSFVEDAARVG